MNVKKLVKRIYLKEKCSCKEIYNILKNKGYSGSRQYINKILCNIPEYVARELEIESEIKKLYFKDKYSVTEVASKINKSVSKVSRILNLSEAEYLEEKNSRKACTKKIRELKRINSKNNLSEDEIIMNQLKSLQAANAIAMSNKAKLTDKNVVEMFLSHYNLDKSKKKLVFNTDCGAKPCDVPQSIKISINIRSPLDTYTPGIDGKTINK